LIRIKKDLGFAMSELPEHVAKNRAYWDDLAQQYVEAGERASGGFQRQSSSFFRSNSPARMLSSWDAAPPTFLRGSRGGEPAL